LRLLLLLLLLLILALVLVLVLVLVLTLVAPSGRLLLLLLIPALLLLRRHALGVPSVLLLLNEAIRPVVVERGELYIRGSGAW
jgi:hypothetical protein